VIVTGGSDGSLDAFDAVTGVKRASASCRKEITALAFSPDGRHLLASCEGDLEMRSADTLAVERTYAKLANAIRSVAWSHDGSRVGSCGRDDQARIWNATTGEMSTFPVDEHCYKVAFSPDGRRFGAATRKTVRMWDLADHTNETYLGHHGEVPARLAHAWVTRGDEARPVCGSRCRRSVAIPTARPTPNDRSRGDPRWRGRDGQGTNAFGVAVPAGSRAATTEVVVPRSLPLQLREILVTLISVGVLGVLACRRRPCVAPGTRLIS
jgi:hypothetical protein